MWEDKDDGVYLIICVSDLGVDLRGGFLGFFPESPGSAHDPQLYLCASGECNLWTLPVLFVRVCVSHPMRAKTLSSTCDVNQFEVDTVRFTAEEDQRVIAKFVRVANKGV